MTGPGWQEGTVPVPEVPAEPPCDAARTWLGGQRRGLHRAAERRPGVDGPAAAAEGPAITNHEYVALRLLDFGFALPQFDDVWESLTDRGLVERRDGALHVTGKGRLAMRERP